MEGSLDGGFMGDGGMGGMGGKRGWGRKEIFLYGPHAVNDELSVNVETIGYYC
jgi:hypothetical protein